MNTNYATRLRRLQCKLRCAVACGLLLVGCASAALAQTRQFPPPPPPPPAPRRSSASSETTGSGTRPRRVTQTPVAQSPSTQSPSAQTSAAPAEQLTNRASVADAQVADEDEEVLTVETDLVTVPVVVTNRQGQPLVGLERNRFRVYEDNSPQQLASFATTETPFEVALLLDTSGSTRAELNLIRRAANLFIESLRPGDRVAIVGFTTVEDAGTRLAKVEIKQPLTANREALRDAITALGTSNGTPFYDAIEHIANTVFNSAPTPEMRGRRAVVALTDGVDSTSDAEFAEARARLLPRGVVCYFVQINTEGYVENRILQDCTTSGRLALSRVQLDRYRRLFAPFLDREDLSNFCNLGGFQRMQISRQLYNLARSEMADLARATGGKTFPTIDLRDARRAFTEVAAEIGTQYSLGYYSSNKRRDGKFRNIRVEVMNAPGAQVRAREGYNAPGGSPARRASRND